MKMLVRNLVFAAVIVILSGIFSTAIAETVAGKAAIVRGKVTALSEGGQTRALTAKSPVYLNDTITTEANSQVQILFNDETVYTLGPQSDMKIDKFVYDPQKGVGDLVVGATKGSFRMITGNIAKKTPERVKVKTPVATIGIRGTYFAGTFNGAALNALLVGGAITVGNGTGERNIRTPGFGTTVRSGNAVPDAPRRFSQQEIKQVLAPTEIAAATSKTGDTSTTATGDTSTTATGDTGTTATGDSGTTATGDSGTGMTGDSGTGMTGDSGTGMTGDKGTLTGDIGTLPLTDTSAPTADTQIITQPDVAPDIPPVLDTTILPDYSDLDGKFLAYTAATLEVGTVKAATTGTSWEFSFSPAFGDPSSWSFTETGPATDPFLASYGTVGPVTISGPALWGINWPALDVVFDSRGEFGFFAGYSGGSLLAGYAGRPIGSTSLPTSGIGEYRGMSASIYSSGFSDIDNMRVYINWGTNKVFGSLANDKNEQTFMTGTVDLVNKRLSSMSILGKADYMVASPFLLGSAGLDFYGEGLQGLGGTGTGWSYDHLGASGPSFDSVMAAIGDPQINRPARPASSNYNGFVSAISIPRENNGDQNMTILTNTTTGAVNLAINRGTGQVGGTFNAVGTSIGNASNHNLAFSFAAGDSVYIDDDAFVNTNVTTTGNVSGTAVSTPAVGTNFNFVGTNPNLWDPIPYANLTWGYWGVEYKTPATTFDIVPGSYWIAGLVTPAAAVPAVGTGTYNGLAMGQAYDKTLGYRYSLSGTSNLSIDFGHKRLTGTLAMTDNGTAPNPMNWVVNLSTPISWNPLSTGFNGVTSATVNGNNIGGGGAFNGAFFDTINNAGAVGGNWSMDGTGHLATGIFVGNNATPPPPPDYTDLAGKYLASNGVTGASGTLTASTTGVDWAFTLAPAFGSSTRETLLTTGPATDPALNAYGLAGSFGYAGQPMWGINFPGGFSEYDVRGEFGYFESSIGNLVMGYAGRPSGAALPSSGIGVYKGVVGYASSTGSQSANDMTLFVNWATGKVFGTFSEDPGSQIFYKGTVNVGNKQLTGAVIGKDFVGALSSKFHESAGPFIFDIYGGLNQGIGGMGSGVEKNYLGNNLGITSNSLAAAIGNPVQYSLARLPSETYKGFVAAISVPRLLNGDLDLAMLMNTNPNDVTLNITRGGTGTVDGSFNNAIGQTRQSARTHTISSTFAAGGSVYIDDDAFVNTGVSSSGSVSTVGPASSVANVVAGNFVVTNPTLWNPIPYDHLTWGYWASEYQTVAGGTVTYNVTPGSYWIAGALTPNANLPGGGTGTYTGLAMGQAYDAGQGKLYSITGTSNLTADFTNRNLTGTLNMSSNAGAPNRMDWSINISGTWPGGSPPINAITGPGPGGATGSVTSYSLGNPPATTAVTGSMNGAFFNTNAGSAKAVAGNWQASGGNHSATGIFVGK